VSVFLSDDVIASLLFRDSEQDEFRSLLISRCDGCLRPLEWPTPRAMSWVSAVACPQCGRHYFTEGRREGGPSLTKVGQPNPPLEESLVDIGSRPLVHFERPATTRLVKQLVGNGQQTNERRRHVRFRINKPVVAAPLDEQARPLDHAIECTLCDISVSGLSLIVEGSWDAPYVLVDFSELGQPGTQFIARVQWQNHNFKTTHLGCKFVLQPDGALPLG
jgi:hypothetical protein